MYGPRSGSPTPRAKRLAASYGDLAQSRERIAALTREAQARVIVEVMLPAAETARIIQADGGQALVIRALAESAAPARKTIKATRVRKST